MGCLFTKKDPSQQSAELNDIHLQIKNKSKDGPILTENPPLRSHINGSFTRDIRLYEFFFRYLGNDNIRQKVAHGNEKVYVAIYDYDARTDEDLTFRVGDLLLILDDR